MKRQQYKILCFLLFSSVLLFSQNKSVDSLISQLKSTTGDIDKANLLNAIANDYKENDPKLTLFYANNALKLAKDIQYKYAEANACLNIGNANIIIGNYALALQQFLNAQTLFEGLVVSESIDSATEVKNGLARAYGSIGVVFSEQSNYAKALVYHLKAIKIYEDTKQYEQCSKVYNNIGVEYESQGNYLKALYYYNKCLAIQTKIKNKSIGVTISNIGNVYFKQHDYKKAVENFNKAKQLFQKYPNQRGLGDLYNSFGLYYQNLKNYNESIKNYQIAIQTFESISDKFGVAVSYSHIADVYLEQRKYNEAKAASLMSLNIAKELGILELISSSEKMISEIFEIQKNLEQALNHYKLYSKANDSLKNIENVRNSVRAEMTFEFDKKQVLRNKEQERKIILFNEKVKRNNQLIAFILIFVLLLFGIGFLIYNRLQLKKTLTLQKELAEYEQKALHLQMNPHFVFNCLGSISSFIVQNGTDSAIKYLAKFSKLMRLTLEYSKESLIPIDKEIESLQNYLELEQLRFNNKFTFEITKSNTIEDDMALPSLLLQPFVENAIIHGLVPKKAPGNIFISFAIQNKSLVCTVTDNGIGYHQSRALKQNSVVIHKSMALDITKKRLEMMEAFTSKAAQVTIDEIKDENNNILGTKVILHLPIQYILK